MGGWERTAEPILPYTTAETMDSGWAWRIDHEHHINRGYVYSSAAISDEAAAAEFLRKNPKAPASPRVVKFRSGRLRRAWVDNVVAIGNAGGFVEPLEATALMVVCSTSKMLVGLLTEASLEPTPTIRKLYNDIVAGTWDDIRDFLALHYRLNTRLDTPFWRHCREDTDVSGLAPLLEFYEENGPTHSRTPVAVPRAKTISGSRATSRCSWGTARHTAGSLQSATRSAPHGMCVARNSQRRQRPAWM